jgi:hypothetical protein
MLSKRLKARVGTALHLAGAVCLVAIGTGCSGAEGEPTESLGTMAQAATLDPAASFTVKLPKQVPVTDSVVTASGFLTLGDRTSVLSTTGKGAVSTTGPARLTVGLDAKPRTVVANAAATIGDRTKIDGDLLIAGAPTIQTGVQVFGVQQLNANVDEQPVFKIPVQIPDVVAGNLNVEPDLQVPLPPAKYLNVSVKSRSTVTLSTGIYEFASLNVLEPQAKLLIDDSAGPVIVYIKTAFIYRGGVQNKAVSGRFPKLLMVYLGTADLWVESPFQGHLFAPNSTAHLRPGTGQFVGSFWGKNVDTNPDTVLVHKPFSYGQFFPLNPVLGPNDGPQVLGQTDPVRYDGSDPLIATPVTGITPLPGGKPTAVNCASNLIAVPSTTQPGKVDRFRYLTPAERAAAGCVGDYKECAIGADGQVVGAPTVPTEAQLNAQPPAGSKCAAGQPQAISYTNTDGSVTSVKVCGVSDAVLSLPEAQRRVCATDAQCNAAASEVCAKFCPPGKACSNEADYKRYCAAQKQNCSELPEQSSPVCIERSVCPFDGYTGEKYKLSDPPDAKLTVPGGQVVQPTTPTLPAYKSASCKDVQPNPADSHDETSPPKGAGNDSWGIGFTPILNYGFTTPTSPLGITRELGAKGQAAFNIDAKVWGSKVPILHFGVDGNIGPDEMTLTRTSELFGQAIDLTGQIDPNSIATTIAGTLTAAVRPKLDAVEDAFAKAQVAQSRLLLIRDFLLSNDLSDLSTGPAKAAGENLCELAYNILGAKMGTPNQYKSAFLCSPNGLCPAQLACDDKIGNCFCAAGTLPEEPDVAAARFKKSVTDAIAVWQKDLTDELNKFGGDPQGALAAAMALIKDQMPGTNPSLKPEIPLKAGRHRFAALKFAFTFPVGPVPVTMSIELAGSWGLEAKLELLGQFDPRSTQDLFARRGVSGAGARRSGARLRRRRCRLCPGGHRR